MTRGSTSRAFRVSLAGIVVAVVAALAPAAAAAQEPYGDWNAKLPGFPSNAPDSNRANCAGGGDECIERTIGEMWRRFHQVVPSCDHNSIFSLTYLRVTEDVRTAMGHDFWPDDNWINRQDALFARSYFLAYDNFRAGRLEYVPESWRIAFGAGAGQEVQGIGNLLLSMNAHVNRDFPFIIYRTGIDYADGRTRKPDHDAYNARLRQLYKPMLAELARRFDPSIDDYDVPGVVVDDDTFYSLLTEWRENAWDYAVMLDQAKNDAERRAVAEEIENNANNWANLIYTGAQYLPGMSPDTRNEVCAESGGQLGDAYRRGTDVARAVGKTARLTKAGLRVKLACPDGMGPCVGKAHARGFFGAPFDVGAGDAGAISLRSARKAHGDSVRLKVRSKLGPGIAVTRRHKLDLKG
jgi:hypothetical protein